MKALRTNPAVRLAAFLLAIATGVGGFWASLFILAQWDTLWTGTGYYTSNSYYQDLDNRYSQLQELAWLIQYKEWKGGRLPYLDQQRLEDLESLLDGEATNFRFAIRRNDTGVLIYTNGDDNLPLEAQVHTVVRDAMALTMSPSFSSELVLEYGVTDPLGAEDEFYIGYQEYGEYARYLPALALLALVLFWAVLLLLTGGDSMAFAVNQNGLSRDLVVGLALLSCGMALCLLSFLLTLAVRVKTHTLLSCTLVAACCRLIVRAFRAMAGSWPLTWRVVLVFLLYLAGSVLTGLTLFLIPFYQGAVLFALCRWAIQWKKVRAGAERILGGEADYQIDTAHMYHDLAGHARQLNDLGQAIGNAVEERIQSERFKAELITNVSHDLKTPLTSIINYVDLLKKQGLDSPDAPAYLEVLDRKSQRLKKLTEDLVEASKASTGSLSVRLERLGMVQLFQQALGEFEEKFEENNLTVIPRFPPEELWIMADGRHLWRILDNLLSNCNKYAQPGTRIYADISRQEGRAVLTVKNVSRQQLNIPAQQLLERFVRGDQSRTTEGSGLGLSIARSLTELQGGRFSIDIDGDLFKAVLSFPEIPALPPVPQ